MAEITLTQGQHALVDDEDFDWLMQWKWYATRRSNCGADVGFYARTLVGGAGITMHRMILGLSKKDGRLVDHINMNGLDNRRSNLRLADSSQNNINRPRQRNNKSGYKGVYFKARDKKYYATLRINKVPTFLGSFDDPLAAHEAYCNAVKRHYGEFARTE